MNQSIKDLLAIVEKASQQIGAIHRAFGAPGDYGYETKEGKALFELYRFDTELHAAIQAASKEAEQ